MITILDDSHITMENYDIFVRVLLTDKVKLRPHQISSKLKDNLLDSLRAKFEGFCSYHGYIRPDSIDIFKYSMGYIQALSLNGDVEYTVNYYADVCNPSIGSIVHTKVVNTNKFGILTHTGIKTNDGKFLPILEIVVARNMINAQNDKNADDIKIGDELHVEILGKKYELMDKKISVIARIIDTDHDKNILDAPFAKEDGSSEPPEEAEDIDSEDPDAIVDEEREGDGEEGEEGDGEEEVEPEEEASSSDDDDDDDEEFGDELESDGFFSEDEASASSDFGSDHE